jgi:uncharacterized protein (DUF1330 family)
MAIEPTQQQLSELAARAGTDADGPVVMLNLNRYRERARYEDAGTPETAPDVSGHEAYLRYGIIASGVLERVGARILWHTTSERTVIGDASDRYDEVIAVWYPTLAAFVKLVTDPDLIAVRHHRVAALERAALICCEAGAEPVLEGL